MRNAAKALSTTRARAAASDPVGERVARASNSSPADGQTGSGPASGTGRPASPLSASSSSDWTRAAKAEGDAEAPGTAMTERATPRVAPISAKRHDKPVRSG